MAFTVIEYHAGDAQVPIIRVPKEDQRIEYHKFLLEEGYWGWEDPNGGFNTTELENAGIAVFHDDKRIIKVNCEFFESVVEYKILPFESVIVPDYNINVDTFNDLI